MGTCIGDLAGAISSLGIRREDFYDVRSMAFAKQTPIRYGSVCSGIEAATVAWEPLGWRAQWFSEIEPFPCTVLQHRHPSVANLGDMTKVYDNQVFIEHDIDLLVGGTPCQSFSSAGKGEGLNDPRGKLALEFLKIAAIKKPRWLIWENVPRVLGCNGGRDFAFFLKKIGELGYGYAYRVLDARFFGVPQRRRRVFLVCYLGDYRPPVLTLFEPKDLMPRPKQIKRKKVVRLQDLKDNLSDYDLPIGVDTRNNAVTGDIAATLGANAFNMTGIGPKVLDTNGKIRIHTPTECERLMGFEDGYTLVDFPCRSKRQFDCLRIKALGNSMVVPVMRWIGERIAMFEQTRGHFRGVNSIGMAKSELDRPLYNGDDKKKTLKPTP
jgi:DNA (cytosine-5)-methyltransferase 1